ncbi:MAG: protein kinase [Myxococcales bacterium]|nr:protein kinase [Myxococcales bacterium]
MTTPPRFNLEPGRIIGKRYVVEGLLGEGWEGQVYRIRERLTGIRRAMKLFFPERNPKNITLKRYAKKLDKLQGCALAINYHHTETLEVNGTRVNCLVSELVEGESLGDFIARQPGQRLATFEALHIIYGLAKGLEEIHAAREYHGDLHDGNVLVKRVGIFIRPRLFDFMSHPGGRREPMQEDVVDVTKILFGAIGGSRHYGAQPEIVKSVCCGRRSDLVRQKFPTASHLRRHLETFVWE